MSIHPRPLQPDPLISRLVGAHGPAGARLGPLSRPVRLALLALAPLGPGASGILAIRERLAAERYLSREIDLAVLSLIRGGLAEIADQRHLRLTKAGAWAAGILQRPRAPGAPS